MTESLYILQAVCAVSAFVLVLYAANLWTFRG